jgi:hypothetical protein
MTSFQSKSAGAMLAALGVKGHSGITCAAHGGLLTQLDVTITPPAWAVLPDGTVLADELASTHLSGLSTNGSYTLWLDYQEVGGNYQPVWSVVASAPTATALDVAAITVSSGHITAATVQQSGWRSLPVQQRAVPAPAGAPTLYGPYVVDYTDFGPAPMEGHTVTLWTPQAGDVLVHLFADPLSCIPFDHGLLVCGRSVVGPELRQDTFVRADAGTWGSAADGRPWTAVGGFNTDALSSDKGTQTGAAPYGQTDALFLGAPFTCADVTALVRWTLTSGNGNTDIGPVMLMRTAGYDPSAGAGPGKRWAYLRLSLNGQATLGIFDGTDTETITTTWAGGTTGHAYWTRFAASGTVYSWRTWADGADEPTTWEGTHAARLVLPAGAAGLSSALDETTDVIAFDQYRATSQPEQSVCARVFASTDPVQIQLAQTGGTDPTQGHVDIFAVIARPVAPS